MHGLKLSGSTRQELFLLICRLESVTGFKRVLILAECLEIIKERKEYREVSTQEVKELNHWDRDCIDRIFQFTIDLFKEPISLTKVAAIAYMSIPAFCNYFKKSTKKPI
jgi:hypothetical protein